MKISWFTVLSMVVISLLCLPSSIATAQESPPTGPIYIVQEGDALWNIAFRFHVSPNALANANGITNADQISIGQQLIIPGLEGIQGILTTHEVQFGESLQSLSLRYQISPKMLMRLNHLTSPSELYMGYSLIITEEENPQPVKKRLAMGTGQSMLEIAILNDTDPWKVMAGNGIDNSSLVLPGDVLLFPGEADSAPSALPPEIKSVSMTRLTQGKTFEIQVTGGSGLILSGSMFDHPLNFYPDADIGYVSLKGVHAMQDPGLYPLSLQITNTLGTLFNFSQMVMVHPGDFLIDPSIDVDSSTLDPETNRTENELWLTSASPVNPEKIWAGSFVSPVDPAFSNCYPSRFGSRRSYNGSAYIYFHTGLDLCGQIGNPIYSAAPGVVVFAGELTIRGMATMIDHGWGVYTAYMHQSEILVKPGDHVDGGQLIGKVGNTGRAEGAHLHFEVLVGGVQVDPLDWLTGEYP